jgi:hypothetical protein
MPVDTFAKRMAVGGVPLSCLGPNVFPGTTNTVLGRGAAAWNYATVEPPPPVAGDQQDKFTLGTKESLSVTSQPTIGGRWSW